MTYEHIAEIISSRPLGSMEVMITESRPREKSNTALITEIEGKKWYCERPKYQWTALDQSFLKSPYMCEQFLLYPDIPDVMGVFDARGLWWAREEMSSIGLVPFFLKNPTLYLRMMARHTSAVAAIVEILKRIRPTLAERCVARKNLREFSLMYEKMYECFATIFMTFDELPLQFRELLLKYLPLERVNTYFPQFLSGESTKAALAQGYLENEDGVEYTQSRGVLYAMHRTPRLFYVQPKFFRECVGDDALMHEMIGNGMTDEDLENFLALRIILPAGFEINEESQIMESMILSPHLGIFATTLSSVLGISIEELQTLTVEHIESQLAAQTPLLSGIAASSGIAEGVVRVVTSDSTLSPFQEGEILVARITDPSMVSAMIRAAAIVTDIGGLTSHPAILSREMGIPCVVNVKEATLALSDGMRIRVDGEKGEIYVLD